MTTGLREFVRTVGSTARDQLAGFGLGRVVAKQIGNLDELIILAGEPGNLRGIELFGIQFVSLILLPLLFGGALYQSGWFSFLFEGPKQALVYAALMILGFMFPVIHLRERVTKRQRAVALQLPDTLDLLTISVEAGLDFLSALRRVVEKHRPGPLKEELERFFKQLELGRARREALREMANRVQLSDLNAVVSALIQADRLGTSVGPILRAQSDMLRTIRSQRAEKAAQEAPVKMLAPLMICILPAVFIMVLGPVIIQMIRDASQS